MPDHKPNPDWASLPLFDRKNWKRVRFGGVVENCNETCNPEEAGVERVVAMEHLEPGSLHVRCWGKVADGTTFTRRCRPGQVLFGKRRAYQRKVAVAEFEAVVSGDIYVLAPKTIELINQNVHVEAVRDDIEALVLDAEVLDNLLKDDHPAKRAREVEIQLIARLRKHAGNPRFKELGERLERIREKHEQGLLNSLEFLKGILELAKETVEAEKQVEPEEEQDRAKAALTELFNEAKGRHTHVIVERIVADIDAIVKQVRFDGWQATAQGEREVKQAVRRALLKYKLHTDQDLFDKAYGYIRQYY